MQINNASIQQAKLTPTAQDPTQSLAKGFLNQIIDNDGIYRILAIDYAGDTRGTEWYSDLVCTSQSNPIPLSQAQKGRV